MLRWLSQLALPNLEHKEVLSILITETPLHIISGFLELINLTQFFGKLSKFWIMSPLHIFEFRSNKMFFKFFYKNNNFFFPSWVDYSLKCSQFWSEDKNVYEHLNLEEERKIN